MLGQGTGQLVKCGLMFRSLQSNLSALGPKKLNSEASEIKKILFAPPESQKDLVPTESMELAPDMTQDLPDRYDAHLRDVVHLLLESEGLFFLQAGNYLLRHR
jgi:hypothetical protein